MAFRLWSIFWTVSRCMALCSASMQTKSKPKWPTNSVITGWGVPMKVPISFLSEQIRSRKAGLFRPGAVSFWAVTGPPEGAAKAEEP